MYPGIEALRIVLQNAFEALQCGGVFAAHRCCEARLDELGVLGHLQIAAHAAPAQEGGLRGKHDGVEQRSEHADEDGEEVDHPQRRLEFARREARDPQHHGVRIQGRHPDAYRNYGKKP